MTAFDLDAVRAYAKAHRWDDAPASTLAVYVDQLADALEVARSEVAKPDRPATEGCICPRFTDTGGFRIADLCCPVHGVNGPEPGDGYWVPRELDTAATEGT